LMINTAAQEIHSSVTNKSRKDVCGFLKNFQFAPKM
jgi:hypothetical protein